MKILADHDVFEIEVTKEIVGLDFTKVGTRHRVYATFIGRK